MYPKLTFERLYNTQAPFYISYKDFNLLDEHSHQHGAIHWHDYLEIELIVDGTCINTQNGIEHHLKCGDVILCRPLDFHKIEFGKNLKLINNIHW